MEPLVHCLQSQQVRWGRGAGRGTFVLPPESCRVVGVRQCGAFRHHKHCATHSLWTTPHVSSNYELLTFPCGFVQLTRDSTILFWERRPPYYGVSPVGVQGRLHSARLRRKYPRYGSWSCHHNAAAHVAGGILVTVHGGLERDSLLYARRAICYILS